MKLLRTLVWLIMVSCLFITFLPYLGFFNDPVMIASLPMPLAVTIGCNIILTLCVASLYPLYFKPLVSALKNKPIKEEKHNG